MSRLSALQPQLRPSRSKSSIAASDTTYHSFHDIDLYAPSSSAAQPDDSSPISTEMRRQDSGYESLPPRTSTSTSNSKSHGSHSPSSHTSRRRASNASSTSPASSQTRHGGRPSIRRASKTSPYPGRASGIGPYLTKYNSQQKQQPAAGFFHFPAHPTEREPSAHHRTTDLTYPAAYPGAAQQPGDADPAMGTAPPQTTHYWTSDRTRRLEYAAIDAASRGVKGWVMRHLVPDCFVPSGRKRVGFDDDSGSVRRYRLDLDEEEERGVWGLGRKTN